MLSNYKTYKFLLLICLCISLLSCDSDQQYDKIDLAGEWQVRLDSLDRGQQEHWQQNWTEQGQKIQLPGTLDEAGIGTADTLTPALNTYVLSNLSRKHQYIGKAWYQKQIEIPQDWDGKPLVLNLERVLWKSTVFINDTKVGSRESLIGNHLYELYDLKTGANTLTILIDNSDFYPDINIEGSRYPAPAGAGTCRPQNLVGLLLGHGADAGGGLRVVDVEDGDVAAIVATRLDAAPGNDQPGIIRAGQCHGEPWAVLVAMV